MQVRFAVIAQAELADARVWYEAQQPGLGARLSAEVRVALGRVQARPLMYPLDCGEVRKCALDRFPYTLRYALRGDTILIVAFSHQHREPDYWIDRA